MTERHTASSAGSWEPVIGIEIHAQLNTASKLFSSDANRFGDAPNENISALSLGLPGSLPVVNNAAVQKAVLFGLAISGRVQKVSQFDRKSYFYPDCPRNYQITQFEHPLILGGVVKARVGQVEKEFHVTKVQLEDDAGMLKHFSTFAGVDFNRSGVPLIEIVSEPCMHSPEEAVAYAMAVRSILDYLDICDCNMEEGSIRFDVNISVRKRGEAGLRNRIEIKNMNSFSNLGEAVRHEIDRQIALYENNPNIPPKECVSQSTYRWDPELMRTELQRSKEDAADYRYFPDPDLLPLVVSQEEIDELQRQVPELPLEKEKRYRDVLGLSELQASFFISDKKMANYFEAALASAEYSGTFANSLANWIAVEFTGRLKERGVSLYETKISPQAVGELVLLISSQKITGKIAKLVADEMVENPGLLPSDIIRNRPEYRPVEDLELLRRIADQVVLDNSETVGEYLKGRDRVFAFLVGQVMKQTKGAAVPESVTHALHEAIRRHYNKP